MPGELGPRTFSGDADASHRVRAGRADTPHDPTGMPILQADLSVVPPTFTSSDGLRRQHEQ